MFWFGVVRFRKSAKGAHLCNQHDSHYNQALFQEDLKKAPGKKLRTQIGPDSNVKDQTQGSLAQHGTDLDGVHQAKQKRREKSCICQKLAHAASTKQMFLKFGFRKKGLPKV